MKKRLTTLLSFPLFLALESAALAYCDAINTGWMDTGNMSQSACLDTAQNGLNQTGARNINLNGSTVFARIGSERVAIRCIAEKQLVYYVTFGCNTATLKLISKEIHGYYQ